MATVKKILETFGPEVENQEAQAIVLVIIGPNGEKAVHTDVCGGCVVDIFEDYLANIPEAEVMSHACDPTKH